MIQLGILLFSSKALGIIPPYIQQQIHSRLAHLAEDVFPGLNGGLNGRMVEAAGIEPNSTN
jgi:hypothetical protein